MAGQRALRWLLLVLLITALASFFYIRIWAGTRERPNQDKRSAWKRLRKPIIIGKKDPKPSVSRTVLPEIKTGSTSKSLATFRLIVVAWRRLASLKRLTDSLLAANYHGYKIDLEFHLDGEAHPKVRKFAESFEWPHGKRLVKAQSKRIGLENIFLTCWAEPPDNEYAFFFEDDISVSPLFFEYTLVTLNRYFLAGDKTASTKMWTERLVGISLNTPRLNEIGTPVMSWSPIQVIGNATQYLHQLPSSWGALFFPAPWRQFLDFYRFRIKAPTSGLLAEVDTIIDTCLSQWKRSWKKYLVEWMYMRGTVMLYPSMPYQQCFSRHYREPGEHTGDFGRAESHLLETVKPTNNQINELVKSNSLIYAKMIKEMGRIEELPILSLHHEKVRDLYALSQLGTTSVALMARHGWDDRPYQRNPKCTLDDSTPPVNSAEGERFLMFDGHDGLAPQIDTLQHAVAYARILGRTLVVPPVTLKDGQVVPIESIINMNWDDASYIKVISLESFTKTNPGVQAHRIVNIVPWRARNNLDTVDVGVYDFGSRYKLKTPEYQATMYSFPSAQQEIERNYGGCGDALLVFGHRFGTFHSFQGKEDQTHYRSWISQTFKFNPLIQHAKETLIKEMKGPVACVVYSRGDCPDRCGYELKRFRRAPDWISRRAQDNCQADGDQTVQLLLKAANEAKVKFNTAYVKVESELTFGGILKPLPSGTANFAVKVLPDIIKVLSQQNLPTWMTRKLQTEIGMMLEDEICLESAFFLGNAYSTPSGQIAGKRKTLDKPIAQLGQ
jgi:hypothetical protein